MPASFTERNYALEIILSEANGYRSRETGTLVAGRAYKAGEVLGIITASGKYKLSDLVTPASDGSQVAKAVLLEDVDATGGDKPGLLFRRDGELKVGMLVYFPASTAPNKATLHGNLADQGIIVR